ncbi:MAG: tRNA 2-thiouridine(34) synthase MnmA [Angelakisella sp.]
MKKKVMIGMSGGVDSSVAAFLLKEQGYEVVGTTFMLWGEETTTSKCCSADDISDARYVCAQLGIPHYVFNFKELFKTCVVDSFAKEYCEGRTPNPCILCNRYIKFDAFYRKAQELGFDYIATGHYAKTIYNDKTSRWELMRAAYPEKDQSYVLYHLTQEQMACFLLPLGGYPKEEIRRIAEQNDLVVAKKPDSQDICFVPDGDYGAFLESYTGRTAKGGYFVDKQGRVLGKHKGISHYTIGQRKGLGISLGKPAFVSDISPVSGNITLVDDEAELFRSSILIGDVNWVAAAPIVVPITAQVKIRYSHKAATATVSPLADGRLSIEFDTLQRAPTKGQAAVLYDGERVLAGGTIE